MKNKIDEKAKTRIITYIASAAGLFLWLLPTHGHVWKGEIEYIYISSESIYFLLIPILGLAIYVGSIWNDKQVIAFSGYVLYAICILLFFYQILTGWPLENIVIGTYLDLFFFVVISYISISGFKGYIKNPPQNTANRKAQVGDAEVLLKYKKLLDAGAITQEEFDAKKKEILG